MPTTVVERYGSLSATGVAKEPSFGTAATPAFYYPMTGNTLELDPGLFYPKVMMGQRDLNIYPLYGQFKNAGGVTGPLFPNNAPIFVTAGIGNDAVAGSGVTGTSPTSSTTLSAGSSAGATTVTLTSATGYAVGNIVQVDVNATGPVTTAECRKISSITTNTLTLDQALTYSHLSGATVAVVSAPFTHSITQANQLPSLTVEKNIGGFESLQFSGSRVNKVEFQTQASNQEVGLTVDLNAKHAAVLSTPSGPIAVSATDTPFVFAEAQLTVFGQAVAQASSATLTIENGLKDTYTLNTSHELQFLTPVTRKVSAKVDLVFTSLDDATWGYWTQMVNHQQGAFALSFTHPAGGGSWTFNLPVVNIKTYADAIKMEDVVLTTLNLDAALNLSTMTTISASLVNSAYLPY